MSPSASERVAVAVSVSPVAGAWSFSATVATGTVFRTVTGAEVMGTDVVEASETVTRTRIRSPWSPLPTADRFKVAPFAPPMSVPFLVHW